ncbi:ABC transporter ATP-binding protein [Roseovarius sp. 2305UL8-3]|uniref:ABC transporter ATP-binding protein n=1 Tax=Roseovarius conchicola TaxID=3121636 RepID=UPI0035293AB5
MSSAPGFTLSGTVRIGGAVIIGPVELSVPAARWTCLLGPSGVGKTTLLRLIAGIEDGTVLEGSIAVSDHVPLPGRIALMAQSDLLMPWLSVLDNVILGIRLRGAVPDHDRAQDLLARVGLVNHARKHPGALSGGERQRVALARTLMEDRAVVLLDEPFSALDARTRAEMQDLAADLLKERTVLMVTHDPGEAIRMGDQVVLLTERGCEAVPLPETHPPRAVDDEQALAAQGALLSRLMARA